MARIRSLAAPMAQSAMPAPPCTLEATITDNLREIGVPVHIKGYRYLHEVSLLAVRNLDILKAVTREPYPTRLIKPFNSMKRGVRMDSPLSQ